MKRDWPQILLILLAIFAVFGQCMTFEFTRWDDNTLIEQNPYVNPPSVGQALAAWRKPHVSLYIPLTYNTWAGLAALDHSPAQSGGTPELNPYLFHAANVLVHCLSAVLVFAILRMLLQRPWIAAAGALLFAVHPFQVEPVAWATGMKDLLSSVLALLAIYLYLQAAAAHGTAKVMRKPLLLYGAAVMALLLGSFAKPGIVGVPLVCVALDWLMLGRPVRRAIVCSLPLIAVVIPSVIATQLAQPAGEMGLTPLWARPLIAGHALTVYLQKLVWPNWFAVDEGYPASRVMAGKWVYFAWIIPAAVTGAILLYRSGRRPLLAAWIVFVAGVAPVLGLAPFVFQYISTVADRYAYLSMLGAALAGAWLLARLKPRAALAFATIILIALGVRSYMQAGTWRDSRTLFEHAVRANPSSYLAHNSLASVLSEEASVLRSSGTMEDLVAGDRLLQMAEDHVNQALSIQPDYYMALKNRAMLQMAKGEVDEALRSMQRSVEAYDRFPEAMKRPYMDHLGVARAAMKYGRTAIAAENARLHLARHPGDAEAKQILAEAAAGPTSRSASGPATNQ